MWGVCCIVRCSNLDRRGQVEGLLAPQHGKGQDDATELGLLEVAAQCVRHVPDVGGQVLLVHGVPVVSDSGVYCQGRVQACAVICAAFAGASKCASALVGSWSMVWLHRYM